MLVKLMAPKPLLCRLHGQVSDHRPAHVLEVAEQRCPLDLLILCLVVEAPIEPRRAILQGVDWDMEEEVVLRLQQVPVAPYSVEAPAVVLDGLIHLKDVVLAEAGSQNLLQHRDVRQPGDPLRGVDVGNELLH